MLHQILKGLVPAATLLAGATLSGCNFSTRVGESEGVPLAELDMSGEAPVELVSAGPDRVIISDGNSLDIDVSGDAEAIELLRFNREDGALGIMRKDNGSRDVGIAIVRITMPSPHGITVAGSGAVEAQSLSGDQAEINVAGSGSLKIDRVQAEQLNLNLVGSGQLEAAGRVDRLTMNVAGSGISNTRNLQVGDAEISIAGSGNGEFASDGAVSASIAGSGTVVVHGRATCKVSAIGSGKVICRPGKAASGD